VPEAALFATLCTFIPGGAIMIVPDAWFPLSGCEPHILALRVRADLGYPENNKGAIGKSIFADRALTREGLEDSPI